MFIKSTSNIGHAECSELESWLTELAQIEHEQPLAEPDYKSTLNPRLLRRMSPILKLGSYCALDALSKADNAVPDAIIVGTGLGCSTDTLTFLNEMNTNLDAALSPTAFIRSTHNTIAGQIALLLKNQGYNMTFTQGSLSFESALSDAQMAMAAGEIESALVGGIDELSQELYEVVMKLAVVNGAKFPVLGQGSNFFYVEKDGVDGDIEVVAVQSFNNGQHEDNISSFISDNGINDDAIDLVLDGGDIGEIPQDLELIMDYKEYCGEFFSASAFGMMMGYAMIKTEVQFDEENPKAIKTILVNTGFGKEQGLILLRKK